MNYFVIRHIFCCTVCIMFCYYSIVATCDCAKHTLSVQMPITVATVRF